jgi:predicted amino acid racemase
VRSPWIEIDLDKIEHNARTVVGLCAGHGIVVAGVTKGTCGLPEVARAMLRGGVTAIGESRMQNVRRLREAGIEAPLWLLRVPPLSQVAEVVECVDLSLNSELAVLAGLSEAALRRDAVHDVIVMVDLGDLREGVWPDDLVPFVREMRGLGGVRVVGLGANLTCYAGVAPSEHNMGLLARCARAVEEEMGEPLACVSGGNSSALPLIADGGMPERIDHVRIGEAILLGRETVGHSAWPDTHQDAFRLHAEVIELKEKPSAPVGEVGEDAFGRSPSFTDRGERRRALVNVGREDVDPQGLTPCDAGLQVLGASSDYLLLDVTDARSELAMGDVVRFSMSYGSLLAAMDSQYVEKKLLGGGGS